MVFPLQIPRPAVLLNPGKTLKTTHDIFGLQTSAGEVTFLKRPLFSQPIITRGLILMESKRSTAMGVAIVNDKGSVSFRCPKCGETEVIRSRYERENAVKYACAKCGFSGPN